MALLNGGDRAIVRLHGRLDLYLATRVRAGVALPETDSSHFCSRRPSDHVLSVARSYVAWMCGKLELPDPHIDSSPAARQMEAETDTYHAWLRGGNFLWLALSLPASTVLPMLPCGGGGLCRRDDRACGSAHDSARIPTPQSCRADLNRLAPRHGARCRLPPPPIRRWRLPPPRRQARATSHPPPEDAEQVLEVGARVLGRIG